MKVYLVGGAVRDTLMNRPVNERDWVVLDSTPEEMIKQGYSPVGKDFPVFLHPKTKEEYALARTERKVSKGYRGFRYYCGPHVRLEDDLKRRDLTINAMAMDGEGKIIDPFNGQQDLKSRTLRHVSPAFIEDPVRLLRVARFAASFNDFKVHPDTLSLMSNMVKAGEVDALVPERVWRELAQALETEAPHRFFEVVASCGASPILWAGLELEAFDFAAMKRAVSLSKEGQVRLAALLHHQSDKAIRQFIQGLRLPKQFSNLLLAVINYGHRIRAIVSAKPDELLTALECLDAFRRPERFHDCLTAVEASFRDNTQASRCRVLMSQAYDLTRAITARPLFEKGYKGLALKHQLRCARIKALEQLYDKK